MINAGQVVAQMTLDTSGFTNGLNTALSEMRTFTDNTLNASQRITGLGQGLMSVGGMLSATVSAPLLGVATASVKVASDFEAGMSQVQAISGATASDMERLGEKAKEMGANTKFSASESAEAFQYMAMAGWKTEEMLNGISGIMDLAAASGENLGLVSDIVTDAITAFGLSASDSAHFADVLASASSNANTNVAMLGESFKYVAPVAGSLGYTVEDTAVALGILGNNGIKAGQAGTVLRGALSSMLKPSDKAAELMDKYNLSLKNSDGSTKSLAEVMQMLRTNLGGVDEATQATIASTIFGTEAMSGMLAIINTTESDYNKLANAIENCDGSASKMAETMGDNLQGNITLFKSALEGAGIAIGELLLPTLTKIVKKVTEVVSAFTELDEGTKKTIVKFGGIAVAIGPVLLATGKLFTALGSIIKVVSALSSVIGGTGLGGLISGLGAGLGALLVPVGIVATGFYAWHEAVEVSNRSITESREEMSFMEKAMADLLGITTYSKEELIEMGLVYDDFNNNISEEFQEKVKEMTIDVHELGISLREINLDGVISEEEHNGFISRIDTALKSALEAINSKGSEIQGGLEKAFAVDGIVDENETSLLEWWSNRTETEKAECQKLRDEIAEIENKAFVEGRALTPEEIAAIEERYQQIKQIELEAEASNAYELEYAHQEFRNRLQTLDAESAEKLLQERAQQRTEEQIQIKTNYDTLIAMAKENYAYMSEEERARADETVARLEEARQREIDISNKYYEEDYKYAIEHNKNLANAINKYTGERLKAKDVEYYQSLVKHKEHYKGVETVTKSGLYRLQNEETGAWETIYASVSELTGELIGVYNWNTGELGAMSKEDAKILENESQAFQGLLNNVSSSLGATSLVYADTENNIRDSSGNIVGHIREVTDENGLLVSSIVNLNGTPLELGDNTDSVIAGLRETKTYLDQLNGKKSESEVITWYRNIYTQESTGKKYGYNNKGQAGYYATGTESAMKGMAIVGEYGPEIVEFKGGEKVYNAVQSQRMASKLRDNKNNNEISENSLERLETTINKAISKLSDTISNIKNGIDLKIENFNNNREIDIEALSEELAFMIMRKQGGKL